MKIEINYRDTVNKANRLVELADEINIICTNEIIQTSNAISSNWQGTGGNQYKKMIERVNTRLINKSKELKETAEAMEGSASRLKKIEEYAASIFSK